METIIFTYEYGWQIGILLLYLPSVITPIILSLTTSIMLKKECMARKTIRSSQIAIIGVSTGIVGWRIGIVLKNLSAEYNVIIILICFTFVAAVFSIGFLNIQKLYYLHKYKKSDLM